MFLVCLSSPPRPSVGFLTHASNNVCRVIDRPGLLTTDHKNLRPGVENFLRDAQDVAHYKRDQDPEKGINLLEVIGQAHPTILIGCSTMPGAFSETVSGFLTSLVLEFDKFLSLTRSDFLPIGLPGDGETL